MGRGFIATDSFVSWFMHISVRNLPFSVGSISWFGLEGRDGIIFFALPLSKKSALKINYDVCSETGGQNQPSVSPLEEGCNHRILSVTR